MESEKIELINNEKIFQLQNNILQCTVSRSENELPRIVSTGLKPSLYSQVQNQGIHSRNAILLLQQEKYRNINEVSRYSKLIHQHNIQKIIDETVSKIQLFSIDNSIDKEVEQIIKNDKENNEGFIDNLKKVKNSSFKITDLENLKIPLLKEPLLPSLQNFKKILNQMNNDNKENELNDNNFNKNNISEKNNNMKIDNENTTNNIYQPNYNNNNNNVNKNYNNSFQNQNSYNNKNILNNSHSSSIKGNIDDINIMDYLNDTDVLFDNIDNNKHPNTNNYNNTNNKYNKNQNSLKRKLNDEAVRCPFENSFKSAKVQLSINQRMKEEGHNPYSNDNGYNNSMSNRYYSKNKYNNNNSINGNSYGYNNNNNNNSNNSINGNSYGYNNNNNMNNNINGNSYGYNNNNNMNNVNNRNNLYSNNNMYNNSNNTSNSFSDNYYNKKMTYGINNNNNNNNNNANNRKRTLGTSGNRQKFVSPLINKKNETNDEDEICKKYGYYLNSGSAKQSSSNNNNNNSNNNEEVDERLKNIEPKMIEMIMNEMLDKTPTITWDDIAGLEHAKSTILESVIWPMQRPDIFTGLRGPPKGLLLYGPPGTGKTLIGKCIASQSGATFFNISSSSLTSKWIGEGEKMVRALFAVARVHQPSVIFVDEIDSLLTQRTDGENEANRRIKTEFLVQFDGCGTSAEDRILLIGATNRPGEIDEAARRRFRKKLYIPLPDEGARKSLLMNLLKKQSHSLSEEDISSVVEKTKGYSGSDVDGLCREAALGPIRELKGDIKNININDVRPMNYQDFIEALSQVRASVSEKDLEFYIKFDEEYGSKR